MTSTNHSRENLIARVRQLPAHQLSRLADYLTLLETNNTAFDLAAESNSTPSAVVATSKPAWPHAPLHRVSNHGTFIVTAATLHKQPLFQGRKLLDLLHDSLLNLAQEHGWTLEAWAVFPNHYHFVAYGSESASKLDVFLTQLHADSARELNLRHAKEGRQVWFNFWETQLTYETSYLARLAYVHQNPVRHGLVPVANQYRWCSAAWFERTATSAQVTTIYGFKTDQVKLRDEYDVALCDVE